MQGLSLLRRCCHPPPACKACPCCSCSQQPAAVRVVPWCAVWRDWSDELRSIGVDDSSPALARRLWWNDPREEVLSPRAPPASPKL